MLLVARNILQSVAYAGVAYSSLLDGHSLQWEVKEERNGWVRIGRAAAVSCLNVLRVSIATIVCALTGRHCSSASIKTTVVQYSITHCSISAVNHIRPTMQAFRLTQCCPLIAADNADAMDHFFEKSVSSVD